MPDSFFDLQKKTLKKRLTELHEEYEAANDQLSRALSDVERIRLQRVIDDLEREIQQVESKLGRVKTSGVSTTSQPVSPEPGGSQERASVSGIKKLLNDWRWIVGTLIAIVGCIGTWLAVPGAFTFFQSTATTTPTAVSTVVGANPDVIPQPTSELSDTATPAPPPTITLVSTSTVAVMPTPTLTPEPKDEPIIFEVCPTDKETGEVVPDATVEIKIKGDADFTIKPKGNGCTEFAFKSFYKGESGLLVINADGYQTHKEYVDIVDGVTLTVELERLVVPTTTVTNTHTPVPTRIATNTPTSAPTDTPTGTVFNTPTASPTATPTPVFNTPTATLRRTGTPIAIAADTPIVETPVATEAPNPPAGQFTLLKPTLTDQPSLGSIEFEWQWIGELAPDQGFEVRVWRDGEPPAGVHDAIQDNQNGNVVALGNNRYRLTTDITNAPGVQGRTGEYLWTVVLVQINPEYKDLGIQATPGHLRF